MPDQPRIRGRARVLGFGMILLSLAPLAELTSWGAAQLLTQRGVLYEPESLAGFDDYVAHRDPVLGWPSPEDFGAEKFDASGSRWVPAYPDPGDACVSLYGDSFTYGEGVAHEDSWANRLSELLGCRVANYGVGGYGTDQALLRFEQNRADEADLVVLGHLSENILRNVNRVRGMLYPSSPWGFKPRFLVDEAGMLELVPFETSDEEELAHTLEFASEETLPHEYFVPEGPSGNQWSRFPYTLRLAGAFGHFKVRAKLAGRPWFAEFYAPDHASGGLEVTARILERFHRAATERGKRVVLLVIPTGLDLVHYRSTGVWVYEPLLARATELGLELVNLGPPLMDHVGGGAPCELFLRCDGHLNEKGNAALASIMAVELERRGLLSAAVTPRRPAPRTATASTIP